MLVLSWSSPFFCSLCAVCCAACVEAAFHLPAPQRIGDHHQLPNKPVRRLLSTLLLARSVTVNHTTSIAFSCYQHRLLTC